MKTMKKTILLLITIISMNTIRAQKRSKSSLDIGADLASRYVWRGIEFSDSPVIQPYVEYTLGNLTLGIWASYETGGQVIGQEFDLYASYSFGAVSLGFTDYSFPVDGLSDRYFQLKNHVGELMVSFEGVKKLPLTLMLAMNIYNDNANSIYTKIEYPFKIGDVELSTFIGGGNKIYTVDKDFAITNVGFSASRDVKITSLVSLGMSVSAIFNPNTEDAYLVFLISL
ncbi:TorF family putative porin [Lutibacter sp.]|uniref:TorF family putative porin n=1 Tax=Lutibacter sp. TaxID=1925666 RepID=UPI0025C5BE5C|nr:TorF family putative porin [Lutibacter sp.]